VRWELRFHGMTQAESGESRVVANAVAHLRPPGANAPTRISSAV
jgi:hypothetical protein